jgi:sigma-B regulation protein RsbU (phosphoserine phosphatase)
MRWNGQQSMRELGDDLAGRTRDVLVRKASLELKDLVDEHATILRRERDLVELALQNWKKFLQIKTLLKTYRKLTPLDHMVSGRQILHLTNEQFSGKWA